MIALCLLLTACGGAGESAAETAREQYQDMAGCTMEATVSCEQAGLEWEAVLRCEYTPDGESTVEVLAPETATLDMDIHRCESVNSLLTDHREIDQFRWDGQASLWAGLDRVALEPLAEILYQERVDTFLDSWPDAEVRQVADSRFDEAVVIDAGENQCFAGRLGRTVLAERVRTDRDLMDHLDDFAAVLAEFQ